MQSTVREDAHENEDTTAAAIVEEKLLEKKTSRLSRHCRQFCSSAYRAAVRYCSSAYRAVVRYYKRQLDTVFNNQRGVCSALRQVDSEVPPQPGRRVQFSTEVQVFDYPRKRKTCKELFERCLSNTGVDISQLVHNIQYGTESEINNPRGPYA